MAQENYRSRTHNLLLYPDCPAHVEAIEKLAQGYDCAYILHDRDYWTAEDEKREPKHKKGTLKKPHWHVVVRFTNAKWSRAVCKDLGIQENYIEKCENFDNSLMYLVHYNDTDKASYDVEEVKGSLRAKLTESINKTQKSEGEKVVELIQFIREYDGHLTVTEFATYCALNGYWSEFRRSGAIFCKIIDEKNNVSRETNQETA